MRMSLCLCLFALLFGRTLRAQVPTPWSDAPVAALQASVPAALAANDAQSAYLQARAWRRQAPGDPAAAAAMANIYMEFGAPAAALQTIHEALRLVPPRALRRNLLALKVQAHAEAGELSAAWANAQALLREFTEADDPVLAMLRQTRWVHFAARAATGPVAAFEARGAELPRLPELRRFVELTPAAVNRTYDGLADQLVAAAADLERLQALRGELAQVAALAAYLGPAGAAAWPPFKDRRDAVELRRQLAALARFPQTAPHAVAVSAWLPAAGANWDGSRRAAGGAVPEVRPFIDAFPAAWAPLAETLRQAAAKADAARGAAEIEAAWAELAASMDGPVRALLDRLAQFREQVEEWQEEAAEPGQAAPVAKELADLAARVEADPALRAARLRLSGGALPWQIKSAAVIAELRAAGEDVAGLVTPEEAEKVLLRRWVLAVQADVVAPLVRIAKELTAKLDAGTVTLADFDAAIAAEAMTPALWERRLAVAEAAGDGAEAAWSALMAWRGDLPRLAAWGEALHAANEAALAADLAAADSATESVAALLAALAHDPANEAAWLALLAQGRAAEDDAMTLAAVEGLWELDLPNFRADGPTLALAARHARWPLLLAMADARVLADDVDDEAHHYRQLAAAALGLRQLAADSTAALIATPYESRARVLHTIAQGLGRLDNKAFIEPETGLFPMFVLSDLEVPDGGRIYLGLALQFAGRELVSVDQRWAALLRNTDPATRNHLDYIRSGSGPTAYLARHPDGREAAIARFLIAQVAALREKTPAARARLAPAVDDLDLPPLLRAAAAALVAEDAPYSPFPLRAADRYHAAENTVDWAVVRAAIAPGQQVMAGGAVQLADWAGEPVLRLAAHPSGPLPAKPPAKLAVERLWELSGFQLAGQGSWTLREDAVLAGESMTVRKQHFGGGAGLWFDQVDLEGVSFQASRLLIGGSILSGVTMDVDRRLELRESAIVGGRYPLGGRRGESAPPGRLAAFLACTLVNDRGQPWDLRSGLHLLFRDTTIFAENPPAFGAAHVKAERSALVSAKPLTPTLSRGFVLHRLDTLWGAPKFTRVKDTASLEAAVAKAVPGEVIALEGGQYPLGKTLELPDGVTLRPAPEAGGRVQLFGAGGNRAPQPMIALRSGSALLQGLAIENRDGGTMTSATGVTFKTQNPRVPQLGVVVGPGARLRLAQVAFSGWTMQSLGISPDRADLRAEAGALLVLEDTALSLMQLREGSRVVLLRQGVSGAIESAVGAGSIIASFAESGRFHLHGGDLRFHGHAGPEFKVQMRDGMLDARRRGWRDRARGNLQDLLTTAGPLLSQELIAGADLEARAQSLHRFTDLISPLVAAARLAPVELGDRLHELLSPAMLRRGGEIGFLLEALYLRRRMPWEALMAHLERLPAGPKATARAHILAAAQSYSQAATPESRALAMSYMRAFPPGDVSHSRAIEAARRGQSLEEFRRIVAEEKRQREARGAAERSRILAEIAADEARRKQNEQRWAEQKRKREEARWPHRKRQEVSTGSSWIRKEEPSSSGTSYGFKMPEYRVAPSWQPSQATQMRDFRRDLDARIQNSTRSNHVPRVGGYW